MQRTYKFSKASFSPKAILQIFFFTFHEFGLHSFNKVTRKGSVRGHLGPFYVMLTSS